MKKKFTLRNMEPDELLYETDDIVTADKFLLGEGHEHGYVSAEMDALSKLCGFEVGSE